MALLGLVVVRVSGKNFNHFVFKNFLEPHGILNLFPALASMSTTDRARILDGKTIDEKNNPISFKIEDQKALNPSLGFIGGPDGVASFYHLLITGKMLSKHHTAMLHEAHIDTGQRGPDLRQSPGIYYRAMGVNAKKPVDLKKDAYLAVYAGFKAGHFSLTGHYHGITVLMMTNNARTMPGLEHEYYGSTARGILSFMPDLLRKLKRVAQEAKQKRNI